MRFDDVIRNYSKVLLTPLMLATLAMGSVPVHADELTDLIVKKLEESGALDNAIERGITRYIDKQREKSAREQEEQEATRAKLAKNARPVKADQDHILGSKDAEITIIEYSDYECPYCKRFYDTPVDLVNKSGDAVNLVWRHFPLEFHDPMATNEAIAADCAGKLGGNPAFWAFTERVIKDSQTNGKGLPAKNAQNPLVALAGSLKLDEKAFQECLKVEGSVARVKQDLDDGTASGIGGTPGVIIRNNKTGEVLLLSGAVPLEVLEEKVKELQK